jgi:tubulin--tyrosine ligase
MASADMNVHLLEVNSYPDFKQTGEVLSDVISGLFEHTVKYAVAPFFDVNFQGSFGDNMEKVLDIKIGSW